MMKKTYETPEVEVSVIVTDEVLNNTEILGSQTWDD